MKPIATELVRRLRKGDQGAWFELCRVFGPALAHAIGRFGKYRFTPETVRDLSQETLSEVARRIDSFDPGRGTRISTWLLAIARHVAWGEIDRRMAQKRGAGQKPAALTREDLVEGPDARPDRGYERAVFRAKVFRAIETVSARRPMLEFEAYRMRLSSGMLSRDIAAALGVSEPSISRYLKRVRGDLREVIREVVAEYSFTDDELKEIEASGLGRNDDVFDRALSDIYLEEQTARM